MAILAICNNEVCSDHFVCGKPFELHETTKLDQVLSLSLSHNGNKLTGNTSRYDRASARAAKRKEVCELLGNELDRKDNEEGNVRMVAVQSGDDEVQHRSELDVVKAELAIASED